jgi:hypothetical protein
VKIGGRDFEDGDRSGIGRTTSEVLGVSFGMAGAADFEPCERSRVKIGERDFEDGDRSGVGRTTSELLGVSLGMAGAADFDPCERSRLMTGGREGGDLGGAGLATGADREMLGPDGVDRNAGSER